MRNVLLHTILLLSPLIGTPRALLVPLSPPPPPSIDISNTAAAANDDLTTQDVSGNTECAAASTTTSFYLSFVSYGNYTALPGTGDDGVAPPQVVSMSFAVANAANGVYTVCAFPLGYLAGGPGTWVDDPSWQACADRRDTDGKHRFTIATGAAFGLTNRYIALNQTWFCHDDAGRLVAYTGIANGTLNMSCADGGELGGYHVENCTSPDVQLPVTLL
ncbi:hypothetical protein F4821DRAFT_281637 [Hypoxylon rubiginosum]|uniref:Uncharacterized protein n=1 Tax=Hypoxylon rubiginosum TaxID=110542 RepID=A0ACC0DE48_9PEZI|nr:hypothetical protein F4821DRAFT_281637 [Hypoxylon rubiginosum]